MKTFLVVLFIFVLFPVLNGQNRFSDKLYDNLKNQQNISLLSFSKSMIDMIDLDISGVDKDENKKITGPLNEVRLAICNQKVNRNTGFEIVDFLKKPPFNEVDLEEKEKDDNMRVFLHRKGKIIQECHVTIQGDSSLFLVSFYGDFKVDDIDKLKKSAVNINR